MVCGAKHNFCKLFLETGLCDVLGESMFECFRVQLPWWLTYFTPPPYCESDLLDGSPGVEEFA